MAFLCNRGDVWENQHIPQALRKIFQMKRLQGWCHFENYSCDCWMLLKTSGVLGYGRKEYLLLILDLSVPCNFFFFFFNHMSIYIYLKHKGKAKRRPPQAVAWKSLAQVAYNFLSFRLISSLVAAATSSVHCACHQIVAFQKTQWDENRKSFRFDVLAPSGKFLSKSFRNSRSWNFILLWKIREDVS